MSNPLWHYTDAARQQQGPIDEDGLAELWRAGRVNAQTLVWREGQAQWLPLGQLAAAMPWQSTGPAPMPPAMPGAQQPPVPPRAPISGSPAKRGIGCGMILVIAAVVSIPMLGILAAIALPAYHDYTQRARLSGAINAALPLKLQIDEAMADSETCPETGEQSEAERNQHFSSAWVGTFENGHCGIELVLADSEPLRKFAGKKIWFWREGAAMPWKCSSEVENRYLPTSCRN